jgi:hypothetical protein
MKNPVFLLSLGSALLLSGCGGGGGGGGSSGAPVAVAPVSTLSTVTATNAKPVAGNAYASSVALSDSSSPLSGMLTGVSVGGTRLSVVAPTLDLIRKAYPRAAGRLLTGVTVTEPCAYGGTMTIEATLRNEQTISNGDKIAITAKNCNEDGDIINGTMAATMSNITGDMLNSYNWTATLDTRFSNFSVGSGSETASVEGDMKIALTQTNSTSSSQAISGTSLKLTEQRNGLNVATLTLSAYSMSGSTQGSTSRSAANFTISGSSNGLGQFSYSVKNVQPFVSSGTSYPSSGALIVNGASSSVTLTVLSVSTVRLDFSARGDGVTTQSSDLNWTELLASI